MARTTNKEIQSLLEQLHDATGLQFAYQTHNSRGYGILYIVNPTHSGIANEIAGNMWEGVTKREAACILRAIFNLLYLGADLSAVAGRIK